MLWTTTNRCIFLYLEAHLLKMRRFLRIGICEAVPRGAPELSQVVFRQTTKNGHWLDPSISVSPPTVRNYLFIVFDKIGVSNRAELILYLLSNTEQGRKPAIRTVVRSQSASSSCEPQMTEAASGASVVAKRVS